MSVDRCAHCGELVNTDNEPESYVQIDEWGFFDKTVFLQDGQWICLCHDCREDNEGFVEKEKELAKAYLGPNDLGR